MTTLLLALALAADPGGVLPLGSDGKPLNLDFETGTLKDWVMEGDAFKGQPIQGDTVHPRRADNKSEHQGQFWIGGYEKLGDKPTGTLTSVPFKVTHPWASFLVAGGTTNATCVEVLQGEEVIFRATGMEEENLRRVAVDLTKYQGKEILVRVVDKHTGHWGHVNFDDFRFHAEKPAIAPRAAPPMPDDYKFAGQNPNDAANNMTVPPGFSVSLFAGEPDLHQPIAMCTDDRGRLWVVEAYTYPKRNPHPGPVIPGGKLGDKILIFEDTDGDGKFDKKTTFFEGLNLVSGIELGFGGVWVGAAPYLLFIPHDQATDKAGEPKILLDGWGYEDTHETLNSFIWGPDGWLYGCHGVFTHSKVGKPDCDDKDRTPINAGVWRYHPTQHKFEVFAHGTSNPWGLDYNAVGDFFVEACVIPHLWHIVQGGRYQRQAGQHFNHYTYDDIKTIAKHRHYVGATPHGGNGRSDSAGGGHAHSGLICYQGGAWPKEYHGKLFMGNIHGHRINVDELKPKGSSYEADRNPDFLLTHDKYAILVSLHAGPDGNVYVCDWSDKQVCHTKTVEIWDRTNGRVFKVSHKDTKPVKGLDLQKCTDAELVEYQMSDNQWFVRHARRILQERAVKMELKAKAMVRDALANMAAKNADPANRLRGLWALLATGLIDVDGLRPLLEDSSEHVRGWALRTAIETDGYTAKLGKEFSHTQKGLGFVKPSPVVLRQAASAALRTGRLSENWGDDWLGYIWRRQPQIVAQDDPLLPYMSWYLLEIKLQQNMALALAEARESPFPNVFPFAARQIGAIGTPAAFDVLVKQLLDENKEERQLSLLRGIADGLKGRRGVKVPDKWTDTFELMAQSGNAEVRLQALSVSVAFGDPKAFDTMRSILKNNTATIPERQAAFTALVAVKDAKLPPILFDLIPIPEFRSAAIRALAAFDDPKTSSILLSYYASLSASERRDAVNTLASRAIYGQALLDAIAAKKIPAADVPAEIVRQLRNLNDKSIDEKIAAVWGVVRDTPADRKKMITDWSKKLTPQQLALSDPSHGRAVFAKVCQQCHTLFGVGGKVGPDITGANRNDLGYLLENMFDPSAVIPKEYAATKFDLADGRVITGILKEETKTTVTVVTANETLTIPVADIDKRTPSPLSMMPDDVAKQVSEPDLRALVAYLKQPGQVPMKANADNAKDFFNGKDLNNWDGDKDVWKVENGEIVGSTKTGLKKNTFLKGPLEVSDFKLSLKVKLTPNKENSGIQFRSVNIEGGEMRGPQADIGKGWWGKLYEESGRGLLVKDDNEKLVKEEDWNEYVIEAVGPTVKAWFNGKLVIDLTDDKLARKGLIAVQVHSGGPMEVRFKDIRLEVIEAKK